MNFYLDIEELEEDRYHPERNPDGVRRTLEGGDRFLLNAAQVWDLLGSDRGESLRRMWREELDPRGYGSSILVAGQIQRLAELLEGIDTEAEASLVDENWSVRPELAGRAREQAPGIGEINAFDGGTEYSLARTLSEARMLRRFLQDALRLGLDVIVE